MTIEKSNVVLIIEDDTALARVLQPLVESMGYDVEHVTDGGAGLELAQNYRYGLVILDASLPTMHGHTVLKGIRKAQDYQPVLMLTSDNEAASVVMGLELGADDYVTKPFDASELKARIKAILRIVAASNSSGPRTAASKDFLFKDLRLSFENRTVEVKGSPVNLTPLEFDVLAVLTANPRTLWSRERLFEHVWGYPLRDNDATINTLIRRLRQKIGDDALQPSYILTVRGVGYKFAS